MRERWRIGEFAAELGLNPTRIRYYERIGLLPKPRRTPAGYRLYESADQARLSFIVKSRAIGLTLAEIRQILQLRRRGQRPSEPVLNLIDRKITEIDYQLRALEDVRRELVAMRRDAGREAFRRGSQLRNH